ncbi:MAG: tyrosine-type recombinase/integrase [Rhizobiaceae bacterium]
MSNLVKRGRYWHYDETVDGVRYRGSTKQTDKQLARAILAKFVERQSRVAVYGAEHELTFKEAARLYLQKNNRDLKLVERLAARLGNRHVATIKPPEIRALAIEFYPQGKPATRNRHVIAPVSAIINHAADLGLAHPIRLRLFPVTRAIKTAGSKPWLATFQAACAQEDLPHLAAIARFMFETGARIGQTVALEWKDLNLQEGTAILGTRKTGPNGPEWKYRTAVLTPATVAEIANLKRIHPRKVFGYNDRYAPTKAWDKLIKEKNLPKLSRHEAGRHGFFTEMVVRNGQDIITAAEAGGGSPQVIQKTYAHAEAAREKIMKVFGGK